MLKKKINPKKTILKTMIFGSKNWLNQKRSLGTQQNVDDIFTIPLFLAMVGPGLIFYYFILE